MMRLKLNVTGKYMIYVTILTTFFRGFIRNFFGIGTILVDAAFAICIIWTIICCMKQKIKFYRAQIMYFIWCFTCVIVYCFQCMLGRTGVYGGLLGLRNDVIYSSLFICAYVLLSPKDIEGIYRLIERLGTLLCAFAIVQYLGRNTLPSIFLDASDADTYWYLDANALRVNGLVGNTIVFGAFTVIMIAVMWAELIAVHYRSIKLWVGLVICISACFLTFGRACFIGCWIVLVVEWVIDYGTEQGWRKVVCGFKFILIAIVILSVLLTIFKDSIIVIRVLDQNSEMNVGTNRIHIRGIRKAIEVISDHLILGYGIDKAGFSISNMSYYIIGDGTFWVLLLQWGVVPVFIFGLLILRTIMHAFTICRGKMSLNKKTAMIYLAINAYFLPASIINSTYDSRICIMLIWLIAGLMYLEGERENA